MKDIESAVEIIGNRRQDTSLVRKARALLGNDVPELFEATETVAVCIAPHVAGGTIAEMRFVEETGAATGVLPVWTSYVEDKFTTRNPGKVNHWRPKIAWPKGQVSRQWIVSEDVRQTAGFGIGEAPTIFSDEAGSIQVKDYLSNVAELALRCANIKVDHVVIDYSDWYARQSALRNEPRSAKGYYPAVMALYSVFGVLFRYDNQPGNEDFLEFRQNIARPAADYVFDQLGVSPPIIARNYPQDGATTDLRDIQQACPEVVVALQRAKVGGNNGNCYAT